MAHLVAPGRLLLASNDATVTAVTAHGQMRSRGEPCTIS